MLCQFLLHRKVNRFYVYIYPFSFRFPSHLGYHRALGRDPWAMQQVLISYLVISLVLYIVFICQSRSPNSSHPPTGFHRFVLYVCLYFCFANRFICTILLGSTYMHQHMTFIFLFLTSCTLQEVYSLGLSPSLQMAVFCFLLWLRDIPYEYSIYHQHEGHYCHVTDE